MLFKKLHALLHRVMIRFHVKNPDPNEKQPEIWDEEDDSLWKVETLISQSIQHTKDLRVRVNIIISDSILGQVAAKFSTITSLDLSYCYKIGTRDLEAIGKSCKMLSSLSWNMYPLGVAYKVSHPNEAHAFAHSIPKLKLLELAYVRINESDLEILSRCSKLESLDLRGCWDVRLDKKFPKEKHQKLEDMGFFERRSYFDDYYSDFSYYDYMDYSDDDSFDGMWDDDGLELRIYEGADNMYEFS